MVAIVGGSGLGVANGSLGVLGGAGAAGQSSLGRSGEQVYVNGSTGNLVIQRQDELLVGVGPDLNLVRTYNSQGQFTDEIGDNWRLGIYKRLSNFVGPLNTVGSKITRTDADGAELVYTYDAAKGVYVNTDGSGSFDTLTYDSAAGRCIWTDGSTQLTETYDWDGSSGKLLSLKDSDGNGLSYGYTGTLLTSITDGSGQTTYLDYAGINLAQIRTVTADGIQSTRVRYDYDTSNRLTSVTVDLSPEDNSISDGKTYVTTYTYDGTSRRIASITQTDGSQVNFTYGTQSDGSIRIVQIRQLVDGSARVTNLSYDVANRTTTITDPLGNATVQRYDTAGRLVQLQGPAVNGVSQTIGYAYDASGNLLSQTDALGNTITYAYDANGNVTLQRDAAGNTVARTYGSKNELLTETVYAVPDPDGAGSQSAIAPQTTRYAYDAENHLRFTVSAEGRMTEYRYNALGQNVATIVYAGNVYDVTVLASTATLSEATLATWAASTSVDKSQVLRTDTAFDFRGQVDTVTRYAKVDTSGGGVSDGSQSVTQYVYDQAGLLLKIIAPKGVATTAIANDFVTSYTYDGLGRMLTATDTLGHVTTTQYDDAGNKTRTTLANGLVTTSTYNGAGELLSVVQGNGSTALGTTQYWYDAAGRLRMTQDPTGVKHYLLYDAAGRQVATIDGNGSLTEYRYNANNQVIQTLAYATALSSTALTSLVDANGQPSNATLASIRPAATAKDRSSWNLYDAAGRLVKSIDALGYVIETKYDGTSRITSVTQYATAINVTLITQATKPTDAAVTPAIDAAKDRTTRTFYDADGKQVGSLDAEGYLAENQYDAAGRLIHTIGYATKTNSALWNTGTLAQLRPATIAQDIHAWNLYDNQSRVIGTVNGEGYLTETIYDVNGRVTQTISYANKALLASNAIAGTTTIGQLRPASSNEDRVTRTTYTDLNQVATVTNAEGTVTRYTYDAVGNLLATDKAFSTDEIRTLQARYDVQGRLIGELSAEGSAALAALSAPTQAQIDTIWASYGVTHAYDAAGRRLSTTDPNGYKTLFFYNEEGQLTHTVNALGEVQESRYDALGQVVQTVRYGSRLATATLATLTGGLVTPAWTNALTALANPGIDSTTAYGYNQRGELTSTTDALGNTTTVAYNAFGNVASTATKIDASTSATTTYTVDRRGQVIQTTEDAGGLNRITQAIYDAFGRTVQTTDGNGQVRKQTYDRLGRTIVTTDPLNVHRTTTYDAFGRVLTQTDGLGNTTTYTYDTANRSLTITSAEGISVTTIRNRHGETVEVIDGNGDSITYAYDRNGNLVATSDALGNSTGKEYDHANRVVATIDANGNATVYAYDAANRILSKTIDPTGLNLTTSYTYDAKGQEATTTDAKGIVTVTQYDAKGQVTSITVDPKTTAHPNGLDLTTTYTYDARGKTLTVTEGAHSATPKITRYTYDTLGRRTTEQIDPNGLNITTRYGYDANDNVVAKTDANGNTTRYAYDANNRLIYTVDPLGDVTQHSYDDNGNLIATTRYATALTTAQRASLTDASAPADIAALLTSTAPDQTTRTVYNQDNQAVYSIDALGYVKQLTYDGVGHVVQTTRYSQAIAITGNPTEEAVQAALPAVSSTTAVVEQTLYDAAGRKTASIDGLGYITQFGYDAIGNLTTLTDPKGNAAYFYYDANNRRTLYVDPEGYVTRTAYTPTGQSQTLTQYANKATGTWDEGTPPTITADATKDRVTTLDYDAAGRLTQSKDAEGYSETYTYDVLGNRTSVTNKVGGTTTYTVDANGRVLTETLPITSANASGTQVPVVNQFTYDALGNKIQTIEALGLPEQRTTTFTYDALGRVIKKEGEAITVLDNSFNTVTAVPTEIYIYDTFGNTVVVDSNGRRTVTYYDQANRKIAEVMPNGALTTWVLDAAGNSIEKRIYGDLLTLPVDAKALPSPVNAANARVTYYTFDANNHLVSSTQYAEAIYQYTLNQSGSGLIYNAAVTITTTYDANGNIVKVVDGNGNPSYIFYDRIGNKTLQIDSEGYGISWEYNAAGQAIKETKFASRLNQVTRNALSTASDAALLKTEFAQGTQTTEDRTTLTAYDHMGRMTEQRVVNVQYAAINATTGTLTQVANGIAVTQYQYNGLGKVTKQIDANGAAIDIEYDLAGRETKRLGQAFTDFQNTANVREIQTTEYDAFGNVVKTTQKGKAVVEARIHTYTYDKQGNLVSETDAIGNDTTGDTNDHVTNYAVDIHGNVVVKSLLRTHADGSKVTDTTRYRYDAVNHQEWQQDTAIGTTQEAKYNAYGEITSKATNGVWGEFTQYNSQGKVWRTNSGDGITKAYVYDANGNATLSIESAGADLSALTLDQMLARSDVKPTITVYDKRNQVTDVIQPKMTFTHEDAAVQAVQIPVPQDAFTEGVLGITNGGTVSYTIYPLVTVVSKGHVGEKTYTMYLTGFRIDLALPDTLSALDGGNLCIDMTLSLGSIGASGAATLSLTGSISSNGTATASISVPTSSQILYATGSDVNNRGVSVGYGAWRSMSANINFSKLVGSNKRTIATVSTGISPPSGMRYLTGYSTSDNELPIYGTGKTTVASSASLEHHLYFKGQPISQPGAATSLKLKYRPVGSTGAYTTVSVPKSALNNGWFVYDWSPIAAGTYEYQYEAYDANGKVVNRVGGQFRTGNGSAAILSKNPQPLDTLYRTELQWVITGAQSAENQVRQRQEHNAFGEVSTEIDGLGRRTEFVYNALGKLVLKRDPETSITKENGFIYRARPETYYYYDLAGNVIGTKDANGNITSQRFQHSLYSGYQVAQEYHADHGMRTYAFDVFGQVRKLTDELGQITVNTYDKNGNLIAVNRPAANDDQYQYDELGNRIGHINALGDRETWKYDSLGRIVQSKSFEGRTTIVSYTWDGTIVNLSGNAAMGGWLKTVTDPNGKTTQDKSDIFNRLRWHKDLGDHTFVYSYNAAGWLTSQTGSTGQNLTYSFYENGYLKSVQDNVNKTLTKYEYDAVGNKILEGYVKELGGTNKEYYQYSEITYDELNRVKTIWDPKYEINYEYDAVGNRRTMRSRYHDGVNGNLTTQEYWYQYDNMNRFTITMGTLVGGRASSATAITSYIDKGTTGVAIAYNAASQRRQAIYGDGHKETYNYNADGYLEETLINDQLRTKRVNDALGRVKDYYEYNTASALVTSRTATYDKDSRQLKDHDNLTNGGVYYRLLSDGTLNYTETYSSDTNVAKTFTYYTYEWWDDAKQSTIKTAASQESMRPWAPGYSNFTYDVNGYLKEVIDVVGQRSLRYTADGDGLILKRDEIDHGSVNKVHNYYYLDGHRIGDVGNDGASTEDYVQELSREKDKARIAPDLRKKKMKPGRVIYPEEKLVATANFDQNYQPINSMYPGATATSYTVRGGESLQQVALTVWGDSAMWYLIADANGLTGQEKLTAGMNLVIPNKVTNIHNNSSTFKVYDPSEVIGDTSPTLPAPIPKPRGGGCSLRELIVMAVAIVVAIYAPELIGEYTGWAVGSAANAVATAAVVSVASQATAMAVGLQKNFSWEGVAMAAVSAGITGGMGNLTGSSFVNAIASNLATQSIGVITGMQKTFDWRGVAAAGISAGFTQVLGGKGFGANFFGTIVGDAISSGGNLSFMHFAQAFGSGVTAVAKEDLYTLRPMGSGEAQDEQENVSGNGLMDEIKSSLYEGQGNNPAIDNANISRAQRFLSRNPLAFNDIETTLQYASENPEYARSSIFSNDDSWSGSFFDGVDAIENYNREIVVNASGKGADLRPTPGNAEQLGLIDIYSFQSGDIANNPELAMPMPYDEQMRNVGNFVLDLGVGFLKGIPNAFTETAAMVYKGWGYIGAQTVVRALEGAGLQPVGSTDHAMNFYDRVDGRIFEYGNEVQAFGGFAGGFISPTTALRSMTAAKDLASTRLTNAIRGTYTDIDYFVTSGLDTYSNFQVLNSSVAQTLRRELADGGMPTSLLDRKVNQILQSGTELPTMRTASTGEFFYKFEPVNSNGEHWSPYWVDSSQYGRLAGKNAMEIGDMLGLPAPSALNGGLTGWRVSEITPRVGKNPIIFESTIAPASQGAWITQALERQAIIVNPKHWYAPRPIATIPAIKVD